MVEFDHFKIQAGLPSFVLSVSEWIEKTNAKQLSKESIQKIDRISFNRLIEKAFRLSDFPTFD